MLKKNKSAPRPIHHANSTSHHPPYLTSSLPQDIFYLGDGSRRQRTRRSTLIQNLDEFFADTEEFLMDRFLLTQTVGASVSAIVVFYIERLLDVVRQLKKKG